MRRPGSGTVGRESRVCIFTPEQRSRKGTYRRERGDPARRVAARQSAEQSAQEVADDTAAVHATGV